MLKFANLTLAQKRFVVSFIEAHPKADKVTLKECSAHYDAVRLARTGAKGEKIGYPNWLFNKNKIERGVYQLPLPTAVELSAFQQELDAKRNPVAKAKAKVAKLAKAKVVKVKPVKTAPVAEVEDEDISEDRLSRIIDESEPFDQDVEDFNQILRENGIEV